MVLLYSTFINKEVDYWLNSFLKKELAVSYQQPILPAAEGIVGSVLEVASEWCTTAYTTFQHFCHLHSKFHLIGGIALLGLWLLFFFGETNEKKARQTTKLTTPTGLCGGV